MRSSPVVHQRSPGRRLLRGRRARLAGAMALGAGWLLLGGVAVVYLGGALVQLWARALVLLPQAAVWLFVALRQGMDWWSIAGRAGAAMAEAILAPQALSWLVGLELVGAAALYGLHRLFRDEFGDEPHGSGSDEVKK